MSRFSMYLTVMMLGWASLPAMMAAVELKQDDQSDQVILSNEIVSIAFNMSNGTYTITDKATGQLVVDQAGVAAASGGRAKLSKHPADGLVQIILERPDNGEISWQLSFE